MLLAARALDDLTRSLQAAIGSMGLNSGGFGRPELIEKPTRDAERIFQGYAKAKPSKEDAYAAARAFLRDQPLDAWQRDLLATAVAEPIRELAGAMVLGHRGFANLLATYEGEARQGELWRLTWHGLLYSYFHYDPSREEEDRNRKGWVALRSFLERTWPLIDRQAGTMLVPDWVVVLRSESTVLGAKPADKYARAYLSGDTAATDQLAADLGIPQASWFWHALVLGAVEQAAAASDAEFRHLIPQLIQLIQQKPGFRDEAIELILNRYHACIGAPQDERLRDFVCQHSVWKNPKLKSAGIATAWNRVSDSVWKMVLGWVNERNLKDFFDILAARNQADEGRLAFWSSYLKQITWTRLVFGADTMALKRTNVAVRDLIAREEGSYAQLTSKREVDAFMMQIGSYLIIEFSKKPNACYVYQADQLPYEPYAKYYDGGTADLAAGYREDCAARIVHRDGWEDRADAELRALGIYPDQPHAATGTRNTARSQLGPDMATVRALVSRFDGATINDRRSTQGGRLWVGDPQQRGRLGLELKTLGFRWAASREAWYYPES